MGALLAAPAAASGSFTTLVANLGIVSPLDLTPPSFDVAPASDEVAAFDATTHAVTVVPPGGGAGDTLPEQTSATPFYERTGPHEQLLVFVDGASAGTGIPGSVEIRAKDGSGAAISLPGAVLPAETVGQELHDRVIGWETADVEDAPFTWGWLGHTAVWAVEGTTQAFDLAAASDDGATVGLIAPEAPPRSRHGAPPIPQTRLRNRGRRGRKSGNSTSYARRSRGRAPGSARRPGWGAARRRTGPGPRRPARGPPGPEPGGEGRAPWSPLREGRRRSEPERGDAAVLLAELLASYVRRARRRGLARRRSLRLAVPLGLDPARP